MSFSPHLLFLVAGLYLLLLFAVAFACDRGWLPKRLTRHPLTYVLSLCVYASAWTIYACIGYAYHYGFNFLTFFLGVSGVFLLAPIILMPILRLTQTYQLASIADLFAFRYRSRSAGAITTLLLLIGMLPLLSLQLQAVATSIEVLSQQTSGNIAALWFCLLILVFAVLFGTRDLSQRQKHEGLVAAIAFESLLKLLAFAAVAIAGFIGVFHSPAGFSQWLASHPEMLDKMYAPLHNGNWHTLIMAFFVAAIVMPHLFHMSFTENLNANTLLTASWALPLLMLIMALCVPFILWAALAGHAPTQPDYHVLGVGLITSPGIALLGYLAGLASASGMLIVSALALSSMCLNHLLLPFSRSKPLDDLYARLLWARRLLIFAVLAATYGFYRLAPASDLTELGSLSFVAALQFVPGLIGLLLWPAANRAGFHAGLGVGFAFWAITLLLPSLGFYQHNFLLELLHLGSGDELQQRYNIGAVSLVVNALVLIVVSLVTRIRAEEREAAEACALNSSRRSYRWALQAGTVDDFRRALAVPLGPAPAERELALALHDLSLDSSETRPYALRRLRDQLESNLSGLLGPATAHKLMAKHLPYRKGQAERPEDTQLIEARIERYRDQLSGLAAELDSLRRFHRQTLLELPMGVISLSDDGEIIGWNRAMEVLTGVTALDTVGARLDALPTPWAQPLRDFALQAEDHNPRCAIEDGRQPRWLSLHKSRIQGTSANEPSNGLVIVVEDITELRQLEAHLTHNERLASIGRLAAGVAHEIGNPVTAIACLAQNMEYSLPSVDADEVAQSTRQIMEQTRRITRIVESLVAFSHSGQPQLTPQQLPINLHDTADEAISLLQLSPNYHDQVFVNQIPPSLVAAGDPQRLLQVFINLLGNACDACHRADAITLSGRQQEEHLNIAIEDLGHGVAIDLKDKLFEPFVTSKAPGRGTGLGLALVYSIMEEHGGSISIDSPIMEERGTRITLTLPCFTDEEHTTA